MAHQQKQLANIVNGPSKWDLMLALFDVDDNGRPRLIDFTYDDGSLETCRVVSILAEDGSGESWMIEGRTNFKNLIFKALFSTRTRRGRIEISPKGD